MRLSENSYESHKKIIKMREMTKMISEGDELPLTCNMMDMVANGTSALLEFYRKMNEQTVL